MMHHYHLQGFQKLHYLSFQKEKNDSSSDKPLELGRFENRRGTQLAPVKLNALKMPASPAGKPSSGMSFMPKGSTLSRNIRRSANENVSLERGSSRNQDFVPHQDDNESSVSDEGSKYSYEDSEDDMDRDFGARNAYGNTGSLIPSHSAYESPDPLDINSLVQLNSKLSSNQESSPKNSALHTLGDVGGPPSLSLRKIGQPTSLKPLQAMPKKKKMSPKKKSKNSKGLNIRDYNVEQREKVSETDEEQNQMMDSIRKEWASMLKEFEKEEKAKYDKMVEESSKKFEEEQALIKKHHADHISTLKNDLEKKIKEEQIAADNTLAELKKSNELMYSEEKRSFQLKLGTLSEEKNREINKMKEMVEEEINQKKLQIDNEMEKEVEMLKSSQEDKIKQLQESYSVEIDLIQKAHLEKIKELNLEHSKELNVVENIGKEENNSEASHEDVKVQQILEQKKLEHQKLTEELNNLLKKIEMENEVFLKLEEKISTSQSYYEEVQDEVDKTENDLDLLRTEKSALISELSILKENINTEKSNLVNAEKKLEARPPSSKNISLDNKAVNTEVVITLCKGVETNVELKNAFCQVTDVVPLKHVPSQTSDIKLDTFEKCSQTDFIEVLDQNEVKVISPPKVVSSEPNEMSNINVIINKSLENALSNMTNKIDERFKVIEHHLGSLSQNGGFVENKLSFEGLNSSKIDPDSEAQVASNIFDLSGPQNSNILVKSSNHNPDIFSQKTCSCIQGNADSCNVFQEVKNSVYRLNDILGQSFIPTLNNSLAPAQSLINYSSPLDTFYTQFRQLQEKHHTTNLKHKCQNEIKKQLKSSAMTAETKHLNDLLKVKDYSKPNNIQNPNIYAIDFPENALTRARNLVLKERARSWKKSQLLNTSFASSEQNLSSSDNVSYNASSRVSSRLSEKAPSIEYPYSNFESDPESEYNSWMSRLSALQQRIRSHKLI